MKRILIIHIMQLLFFIIIEAIFKTQGYNLTGFFGQETVFFYFIFPFALTFFLFGIVYIWLSKKEMKLWQKLFASVTSTLLALASVFTIQIYVQFGSNLQILTYVVLAILVVLELVWYFVTSIKKQTTKVKA